MGRSPSADLFWGYDLADYTDDDTYDSLWPGSGEDEEFDWESVLARRLGWVEVPHPQVPAELRPLDWSAPGSPDEKLAENRRRSELRYATPEWQAWAAKRTEKHELIKDYPVEIDSYGYSEEPSYCVRVKDSVQHVGDYGSITLTVPLVVDERWAGQVEEFMGLLTLPVPADAKLTWHLNCSYG